MSKSTDKTVSTLSFGDMIAHLKTGGSARRAGWPESDTLALNGDKVQKNGVKWLSAPADTAANDWLAL